MLVDKIIDDNRATDVDSAGDVATEVREAQKGG